MNLQKNAKVISIVSAFGICFIWFLIFGAWATKNTPVGSVGFGYPLLFFISLPFMFGFSALSVHSLLKPNNSSSEQEVKVTQDKKDLKIWFLIVLLTPFILVGLVWIQGVFFK